MDFPLFFIDRNLMAANGSENRRRFPPIPIPIPPLFHAWFRPSSSFFSLSNMWEEEEEEDKSFRDLEGGGGRRKKKKKFAHIRPILFSKMAKKIYCIITAHVIKHFILVFGQSKIEYPLFFFQTDGKQLPRQPSNFEKNYIHRKHYAFPQNCSSSVLKNPPFPQLLPPPLALICSIPIVLCSSSPLLLPLIHSHYLL